MAIFDLSTPEGRFNFSTNKTLEFAFQQAIVEVASESISDAGDGSAFPYNGNIAYNKIYPALLEFFRNGISISRPIMQAFIATLPQVSVDEDNITTSLYNTLIDKVKIWIEYREGVSSVDKITSI